MPWLRANRDHACAAPLLGEASLLCPKGFAATRVYRAARVAFFGLPFLGVPEKAKCCPFCKYSENSAVGETVPRAAPGTRLCLRARCSGYSVGRRSPLEPATRKGSPGVEFSTALLSTVMGAKFELRQASEAGKAARFCENSAVGETVPSAAPGTRLRLRARCSGCNVGGRSPLRVAWEWKVPQHIVA